MRGMGCNPNLLNTKAALRLDERLSLNLLSDKKRPSAPGLRTLQGGLARPVGRKTPQGSGPVPIESAIFTRSTGRCLPTAPWLSGRCFS
jgi:hypothetical protein